MSNNYQEKEKPDEQMIQEAMNKGYRRGTSFRITLPVKVARKFELTDDYLLVFGEKDREIVLRKMKMEDTP